MKTCCMCKESLPLTEFRSNKRRKDGLQSQCIACQKEYRRQHYTDNRQKYIDKAAVVKQGVASWWRDYKKQFSCSTCGENHPACLDFHHPDGTKEKNVARMASNGSKRELLAEIAKCIPLCANCHRKLHYGEREQRRRRSMVGFLTSTQEMPVQSGSSAPT